MRPGFLGDFDVTAAGAAKYIKAYQRKQAKSQRDNSSKVWGQMYKARAKTIQKQAKAAAHSLDAGNEAVTEVKKVADGLVETKKLQAKVAKESAKAAKDGNMPKAKALAEVEIKIAKKAKVIEGQLATRVDEGVKLAKVKRSGERVKAEVDIKKASQAARFPHLTSTWAKQDALYDRNRNKLLQKHHVAALKGAQITAYLKTLPAGLEKDAKLERQRKQAATRRINQAHEVAKLDDAEAGKIDAREKTSK